MVVFLIGNALAVINKGFCGQLFLTLESQSYIKRKYSVCRDVLDINKTVC